MATNQKKTEYFKKFISETEYIDTAYHGSPRWEPSQTIGKEDDELRKEIISKFALKHYSEGFDGNFQYKFNFCSKLDFIKSEEHVPYITVIEIKKAGKLEKLSDNCDLEDFLLDKGFKRIEEK